MDAKCLKHLFRDDAIASVLQLDVAGALRPHQNGPSPSLEVCSWRSSSDLLSANLKNRSCLFHVKAHMNHQQQNEHAAFTHPFLRGEESHSVGVIDMKLAAMRLPVRVYKTSVTPTSRGVMPGNSRASLRLP